MQIQKQKSSRWLQEGMESRGQKRAREILTVHVMRKQHSQQTNCKLQEWLQVIKEAGKQPAEPKKARK